MSTIQRVSENVQSESLSAVVRRVFARYKDDHAAMLGRGSVCRKAFGVNRREAIARKVTIDSEAAVNMLLQRPRFLSMGHVCCAWGVSREECLAAARQMCQMTMDVVEGWALTPKAKPAGISQANQSSRCFLRSLICATSVL